MRIKGAPVTAPFCNDALWVHSRTVVGRFRVEQPVDWLTPSVQTSKSTRYGLSLATSINTLSLVSRFVLEYHQRASCRSWSKLSEAPTSRTREGYSMAAESTRASYGPNAQSGSLLDITPGIRSEPWPVKSPGFQLSLLFSGHR